MQEIVRLAPRDRQTMLFSATMTEDVEKLVKVSLRRPVRLAADAAGAAPDALSQEIIRLKVRIQTKCSVLLCPDGSVVVLYARCSETRHNILLKCSTACGITMLYMRFEMVSVPHLQGCQQASTMLLNIYRVRRRRRARRRCCWRCAPRPSRAAAPLSSSARRHAHAHAVCVTTSTPYCQHDELYQPRAYVSLTYAGKLKFPLCTAGLDCDDTL